MKSEQSILRKSLGRTGIQVSALGFGCAPLGDLFGTLDESTAVDTIVAAVESGGGGHLVAWILASGWIILTSFARLMLIQRNPPVQDRTGIALVIVMGQSVLNGGLPVAVLTGILALYCGWWATRYLARNRPRGFVVEAIPDDVLPKA